MSEAKVVVDMMKKKHKPLEADERVCFRCKGSKKMYKHGSGYTHANVGGKLVDCPMCNGDGKIKKLDAIVKKKRKKIEPQLDKLVI